MQNISKIGVLGGDLRQLAVASMFAKLEYECAVWGIDSRSKNETDSNIVRCVEWKCALSGADVVILPLPITTDGIRLNCGRNTDDHEMYIPRVTEIIQQADRKTSIFGGKIPANIRRFAEEHNVRLIDYYEFEDFQIKNAVPTAEGTIGIAIKELDITLSDATAAVVGYGRIGRTLSQRLKALGCDTTCIARSNKDLAWAACDGCKNLRLRDYFDKSQNFDVIFNTVPHIIFDDKLLRDLDKTTLIIDLASQNGGVDTASAEKYGIKVVKALSLPGKTSPKTAGKIIYETVINVLNEEGQH